MISYLYATETIDNSFENNAGLLSAELDRYFERLQLEGDVDNSINIDQLNEVKGKPLDSLLRLAFGQSERLQRLNEKDKRVLQWEAKRKLVLMLLLNDVANVRQKILLQGIQPIDEMEEQLEASSSRGGLRQLLLNGVVHNVKIERREKGLLSLLRKVIVRDQTASPKDIAADVHAESYIFTGQEANITPISTPVDFPLFGISGEQMKQFDGPAVVYDLMSSLMKVKNGDHVRIIKYKGPPREGEVFGSSGAGGGGKIRMAKFYIEHTDTSGVIRQREVQVFIPNVVDGEWVSGEVDYKQKKDDDRSYGIKRLFHSMGLRSFMELLYPAEIYGDDIRSMYKGKVK